MIGTDTHCQIVAESLAGERPVDERTYASVAVLAERLERLQGGSRLFAGVTFSPYVQHLSRRTEAVALA